MKMFDFCISGFWDRLLDFSLHSYWGYSCTVEHGLPLSYTEQHRRPGRNMEGGGGMASRTLPQQHPMDYLRPRVPGTALGPREVKMGQMQSE